MDTCGTDRDFLIHYGVAGMRWGVRRYTNANGTLNEEGLRRYGLKGNRSARGTARDLNRLDREQTTATYRANLYGNKIEKKIAKARRTIEQAKASGNVRRQQRAEAKIEKLNNSTKKQRADAYRKLAERSKALSEQIIQKSLNKKFSVNSRNTMRFVTSGRTHVTNILGMSSAAVLGIGVTSAGTSAIGKKYKVRNNGLGLRTHKDDVSYVNRQVHSTNVRVVGVNSGQRRRRSSS